MPRKVIRASVVRQWLDYKPRTGVFRWKKSGKGKVAGEIAGKLNHRNRRVICIDGGNFFASILAVVYMTGRMPAGEVDHKDCDTSNDKYSNLRIATKSQNAGNVRLSAKNKSGYKNVYWCKKSQRWVAYVRCKDRKHYGGYFRDLSSAAKSAKALRKKLWGEFARDK